MALLPRSVAGLPSNLGEADAVGRRMSALGVPRCAAVPVGTMRSRVPVLPARVAGRWGASFCRKPPVCLAVTSHHFCRDDDARVPRSAHFSHYINIFPCIITEDRADGWILPL